MRPQPGQGSPEIARSQQSSTPIRAGSKSQPPAMAAKTTATATASDHGPSSTW